ncbi:hypothetical protein GCM10010430_60580 [Kitasatospora cystarginea]|uniref:Uncharacterized protein n=1 Tax=Kitasatospora cystarginea TaxID=58350 RepID=A0ABP5RMD0_9ACTN
MSLPTTPQSYAQWLRDIADGLEFQPDKPNRALLQALVGTRGLLQLASEVAYDVRTDLDTWDEALRADPFSAILHDFSRRIGIVEETILDTLEDAGPSMVTVERLMADHANPAEAAAASRAVEQAIWDGPEVRGNERVHLWWVDGSNHAPLRGLAPTTRGYVDTYGTPLFTREVAEQVVADLLSDNAGFEAAFQPDGSLLHTWPKEYDGEGGRMHVLPDDRGLYAIGGQWPWGHCRPGNAYLAPRAEAARLVSRTSASSPVPAEATAHQPAMPSPAPGRTR